MNADMRGSGKNNKDRKDKNLPLIHTDDTDGKAKVGTIKGTERRSAIQLLASNRRTKPEIEQKQETRSVQRRAGTCLVTP
jgi:hypothetical protein